MNELVAKMEIVGSRISWLDHLIGVFSNDFVANAMTSSRRVGKKDAIETSKMACDTIRLDASTLD